MEIKQQNTATQFKWNNAFKSLASILMLLGHINTSIRITLAHVVIKIIYTTPLVIKPAYHTYQRGCIPVRRSLWFWTYDIALGLRVRVFILISRVHSCITISLLLSLLFTFEYIVSAMYILLTKYNEYRNIYYYYCYCCCHHHHHHPPPIIIIGLT
jgi:hypothetical protein